MFHSNTDRLIDYWRGAKGEQAYPLRTTIDPGAFADLLPQVFILGREAPGRYRFRLSGGFVADLHGRELKGELALPLWTRKDRARVQAALESCRSAANPVVLNADVTAQGAEPISMEVLVAPLAGPEGGADRYLGLYQPTGLIQWLEEGVIRMLSLNSVVGASDLEPRLRLAVINGREVA